MFPFFQLLQVLLACCSTLPSLASSPTNYNPVHYDRMRHFTPDGRLLQVEYAMRAQDHSSPLVVCQLDADTLVLLSTQKTHRCKPQDRMVVLDEGVVVSMSGVLADSLALLRHSSQEWLEWKILHGEDHNQVAMHVLSQAIASACHLNSLSTGIRPFGAALLLVGAVADGFQVLQTDPSGAITEVSVPSDEPLPSIDLLTILGGQPEDRNKIEKAIQKYNDKHPANEGVALWHKLQSLTRVLLDCQADQDDESSRTAAFLKKINRKRHDKQDEIHQHCCMEAVLVSRKLGIHRLNEGQIQRLHQQKEEAA